MPRTSRLAELPKPQVAIEQHPASLRRILHVNTADLGGGTERFATTLLNIYRQRGFESHIAVGDKRTNDPDVIPLHSSAHIDYRLYADNWQQWRLQLRRWLDRACGWLDWQHPYSHRLTDVAGARPDIVHLHNLHGGYFDLRAAADVSRRIPTFVTLNDCWWFSGHCVYPLDCDRWQHGCGRCPMLRVAPEPKLRDATRQNWHAKAEVFANSRFYTAAPSQWLLDRARQSILAPAIVEGRVIRHGVDINVFCPGSQAAARHELDLPSDAFVLMFAAHDVRSSPFKDYDTVRRAIELVAAQQTVWLLAVGEAGDDEQWGQAHVRHVPFLNSQSEMARHFQAANVYLHAAHNEAFGIVIAEALACGLPVVATAVDGIPEVFANGEHGFLVPRGNASAMAYCVLQLFADVERRTVMGLAARRHARLTCDAQHMAQQYLDWYQEILSSAPNLMKTSNGM